MTVANSKSRRSAAPVEAGAAPQPQFSIADLVLVRVAAAPATRADLQRDLLPISGGGKAAGTTFRQTAELAIGAHVAQRWMTDAKGRLQVTEAGRLAAERLAPNWHGVDTGWDGVRAALLASVFGVSSKTPQAMKALQRNEGLAAIVLQRHFKIPGDRVLSPTDLRTALAVIALERAFGDKIKTGLGKGSGLPGKAGRVLAGQLFSSPREFSSDGKLIIALAADVLGTADTSLEGLTIATLRRLTPAGASTSGPPSDVAPLPKRRRPSPTPDNDSFPLPLGPPAHVGAIELPNMAEFASAVLQAARGVSQGWPGARKAFISLVWRAIRNARPDWGLTEAAFKGMLAEGHRTGTIVLASADLKDRCDLSELEDSKILYKNTVWHFVRVED